MVTKIGLNINVSPLGWYADEFKNTHWASFYTSPVLVHYIFLIIIRFLYSLKCKFCPWTLNHTKESQTFNRRVDENTFSFEPFKLNNHCQTQYFNDSHVIYRFLHYTFLHMPLDIYLQILKSQWKQTIFLHYWDLLVY